MKIVLNALQYKPQSSGIGMLLRGLFGALAQRGDADCTVILSKDSPPFPAGPRTTLFRTPYRKGQNLRRLFFQTFALGPRFCKDAALLASDSKFPLMLPRSCTVVPVITDLALYRMPETYQRSRVLLWKAQYRRLVRRADHFIAISECTRRDMTELLGIAPERIDVVYCAADDALRRVTGAQALSRVREAYGLPARYILFVGSYNPRKNLTCLLEAFDRLKAETDLPHRLVIVGEKGWKIDGESARGAIRHAEDVQFVGYVDDADLAAVYTLADVFAYPTLYEGFGIPIIEAQQCGTPVVAGNTSSMPEVGGEGALYVDPYRAEDICQGLKACLTEPALSQSLVAKGYANAGRFSWAQSAAALSEILSRREAKG